MRYEKLCQTFRFLVLTVKVKECFADSGEISLHKINSDKTGGGKGSTKRDIKSLIFQGLNSKLIVM